MTDKWQEYPHIVALFADLDKWKDEFQIFEYVTADDSGYDKTGRIEGASDASNFEIASEFCWTHFMSDGEWIESGVRTGDWGSGGVYGWFIGRVQRGSEVLTLQTHAFMCSICEGHYSYEGEDGQDLDCDACSDQDAEFINLVEVLNI